MAKAYSENNSPPPTLSAALRIDNGEMIVTLSERISKRIEQKDFYGVSFGRERPKSYTLKPLSVPDYKYKEESHILMFQDTVGKQSKSFQTKANETQKLGSGESTKGEGLLPILIKRNNQETKETKIVSCIESVKEHVIQNDVTNM
jgi:hypothetical protein